MLLHLVNIVIGVSSILLLNTRHDMIREMLDYFKLDVNETKIRFSVENQECSAYLKLKWWWNHYYYFLS